jgi:hypothetical protein
MNTEELIKSISMNKTNNLNSSSEPNSSVNNENLGGIETNKRPMSTISNADVLNNSCDLNISTGNSSINNAPDITDKQSNTADNTDTQPDKRTIAGNISNKQPNTAVNTIQPNTTISNSTIIFVHK